MSKRKKQRKLKPYAELIKELQLTPLGQPGDGSEEKRFRELLHFVATANIDQEEPEEKKENKQ